MYQAWLRTMGPFANAAWWLVKALHCDDESNEELLVLANTLGSNLEVMAKHHYDAVRTERAQILPTCVFYCVGVLPLVADIPSIMRKLHVALSSIHSMEYGVH
jgi:hypothetical protein